MKLTPALLVAALVGSVSTTSYDNCCCTKKAQPSGNMGCDDAAGNAVISAYGGKEKKARYAWSSQDWEVIWEDGPKYAGKYFYATGTGDGKKNHDHKIGAQEIGKACEKQGAGQSCFNIPEGLCIDYAGNIRRNC